MSMREIVSDMTHEMVGDRDEFDEYLNAPESHNNQGYVQRDYKTGMLWVHCCHCGKKQFSITDETRIHKLPWKCKGSSCKKEFEVNV